MKPTESQDSSLKGSNLIFLISQPRSGSTLTQRILGGHPDIHTLSEPWLMLSPLTAWHSTIGYNADYDQALAQVAVSSFIGSLSEGEEDYVQGLRRMYSYLYEKAIKEAGKSYFLDKTPRYFYIISELYRTFPEARFIFLFRNPLSVLCSIITTWAKDDLHTLKKFKNDLFMAPQKLLEGVTNLGKQCLVIHYEWLLMSSDDEIARVCDFLGISFRPEVAEYGVSNTSPAWMYGDQEKLYQKTKPDSSNLNKWLEDIKEPQIWRLASDYLQTLGEETIEKLGYSYQELWSTLNQEVPTIEQLKDTFPLEFYCEETLSSSSEVSHFIQLTQKSLGGWIGAKKEAGEAFYGLPKQQEAQYQESLTRVHSESQKLQTDLEQSQSQLHQTQTDLEQSQSQLHQTQEVLEQSQSQLHQTQEVLEQFQDQMQQAETLLQEYQAQLHSTQAELEQSQSQLHSTQAELEQFQDQMQQAETLLQEYQAQLHSTQAELAQSQSQLHSTEAVLDQYQSQLHSTEVVLEQSQSQLHQNRAELAHQNSQLHQSEWELERTRFQLHQTQAELASSQAELAQCNSKVEHIQLESEQLGSQIGQVQGELEHSQSKLRSRSMEFKRSHSQLVQVIGELEESQIQRRQTEAILQQSQSQNHQLQNELKRFYSQLVQVQEESQDYQSQLVQVQKESEHYQSQLVQVQKESQDYQSQLVQVQEESQDYQSQLVQVQEELERSHFQQQYAVSDRGVESQMPYTLLVRDAWYAYQSGDLKKMQQCLQESLKITPISRTESVVNWLESFCQFSAEKGQPFDTYSLTNSQEWKRLMQGRFTLSQI